MRTPEVQDVRIPADPADQLTTDAKSALPPAEFRITTDGTVNIVAIQDRQGVQNRVATASYRIYFLPAAFAPNSVGSTTTVPTTVVNHTVIRAAGRKVASLVTDISSPALGTILTFHDTVNVGQKGFYYCVAVNRSGVEAPPEQIVKAP